ncbi:MAG: carboxylating nicotinate-nucleotide diphosphorylase [Chloroflexi bacterium]|nr:MAG: carboxylating nicotinate-nucleotide diphosphorylase [Chloroflexota bacterium]
MIDAIFPPDPEEVARIVTQALSEDRAFHDVTTRALVPDDQQGKGAFLFKQGGVVCGMDIVETVFGFASEEIELDILAPDGSVLEPGQIAAEVSGPLAAILSSERVALNLLQRMSGIASMSRRMVMRAAEGGSAQVVDTRKTTPGLRELERYAVRVGGAKNHRNTLEDGVLIKDNHIAAAMKRGLSIAEIVADARMASSHLLKVEIEVTDAAMALLAMQAGADVILLDNMTPEQMRAVVADAPAGILFEASGGVNEQSIRDVAATGVHLVSVGALTHSAPALDISLEIEAQ